MAVPPNVSDFMECKVFINNTLSGGWTEKYCVNQTSYTAAQTVFETILNYRSTILANDYRTVWATMSKKTRKGDSEIPTTYTTAPVRLAAEGVGAIESGNLQEDAALFRFDTGIGKFSNRAIRGLRDSHFASNTIANVPVFIYPIPATPAVPALGTSLSNAVKAFLVCVANNTRFMKLAVTGTKDAGGNLVGYEWDAIPYNRIQYRKVSHRDTGGGFNVKRGRRKHAI